MIKSVAVFCSASNNVAIEYMNMAYSIGNFLARNEYNVVYGGGEVGLMGALARGVAGVDEGLLSGVSVECLEVEAGSKKFAKVTAHNMSKRKRLMSQQADAYVILPGGFGTLDEMFEVLTLQQLNVEAKPIIIYDEVPLVTHSFVKVMRDLLDGLEKLRVIKETDVKRIQFAYNDTQLLEILRKS
jgi:uncharacterized protein (TIGR00730 family)